MVLFLATFFVCNGVCSDGSQQMNAASIISAIIYLETRLLGLLGGSKGNIIPIR
jgi:hypothetical protein